MNCKFCGASCTGVGKDRDMAQCLGFEPITNQEAMARLSPEEFYKKMHWLMFSYGCQFNSTELAVIDWLKQEVKEGE